MQRDFTPSEASRLGELLLTDEAEKYFNSDEIHSMLMLLRPIALRGIKAGRDY